MALPLNPMFIPAFSIETVILDKDSGAPLSGGLVYFEKDNQRGVLKPVYQITGTSPNYTFIQLPNPMELSSIGTFVDALGNPVVPYFFPFNNLLRPEYYYIRVESALGVPQFTREAVPYIGQGSDPGGEAISFTNELSNPQFAEVLFDTVSSSYTYTFTDPVLAVAALAPDWDLVVSGTGACTVVVSQTKPLGSLNRITNPGTLLNITSTGLTRLRLRQRLYGSPNLFGSGYLSGYFVAKTFAGGPSTITMYYSQSNGVVINEPIVSGILPATGNYTEFTGNFLIPASTSTQNFPNAYVDIEMDLPVTTNIEITSIQLVSTNDISVPAISYDQISNDRQIDYLFHYYKPQLAFKPIPSMLTAWDFNLNPAQFSGGSTQTIVPSGAAYIWDQTISKSTVGNMSVIRNAVTGGFQVSTVSATDSFYMIQYLSGAQARAIVGNNLAVNLSAFRTQAGGDATARVYLYRGTTASTIPILPLTIGTMTAGGIFTLTAANWTLIPRGNLGQTIGTLPVVQTTDYTTLNTDDDLQFNGWQMTTSADIADTDKFAIVVTFQCPTAATVITVDSISLMAGDIATRPAPQTFDEVLRECQYYYEKSTNNNLFPSTASIVGSLLVEQKVYQATGSTFGISPRAFAVQYYVKKRVAPTIVIYSALNGVINTVWVIGYYAALSPPISGNAAIAFWTIGDNGQRGFSGIALDQSATLATSGAIGGFDIDNAAAVIVFHYTADCRLAIIA